MKQVILSLVAICWYIRLEKKEVAPLLTVTDLNVADTKAMRASVIVPIAVNASQLMLTYAVAMYQSTLTRSRPQCANRTIRVRASHFAPLTFKCTQRNQARSYARTLVHTPTFVTRTLPSGCP